MMDEWKYEFSFVITRLSISPFSVIKRVRRVEKVIGISTNRVLAMSWRGHFKNKRRYDTPGQTQWRNHRGLFLSSPI